MANGIAQFLYLLGGFLGEHSPPVLAGFLGGCLSQFLAWFISSRKKDESPADRAIRRQIVLLWIVIGVILFITIQQQQNIKELLDFMAKTISPETVPPASTS
jgi:peptidoglycan biosynthesis protein MviN/MurJ (putative lipid II flippase)